MVVTSPRGLSPWNGDSSLTANTTRNPPPRPAFGGSGRRGGTGLLRLVTNQCSTGASPVAALLLHVSEVLPVKHAARQEERCRRPQAAAWAVAALTVAVLCAAAQGYVEAPYTLGRLMAESQYILVVRVEKIDRDKNLIVYRKVRDIKGKYTGEAKHSIGTGGFHPREWQTVMAWATVGKTAVLFTNGSMGEVCIDKYWYQVSGRDWSRMTHAEPYMLRSFAGRPEKLAGIVAAMLAGREVVAPCMVGGDKTALQLRTAKIQRLRAGLKILDYNPKRDFVGWGAEEFRLIRGMKGFTHYGSLNRLGMGVCGVAPADFNGDGKTDLCLLGDGNLVLLQNAGAAFNEVALGLTGGARAAAWGDYNRDGKPDLLLATPMGPKLFRNSGKGLTDVSDRLPAQRYHNVLDAAWIDYDGDKRPDILLADGFRGLRLYRNTSVESQPTVFEDVSDKMGLGAGGIAGTLKGRHLAIADVNGDGRTDVLYGAGTGVLALNTSTGFIRAADRGIEYSAGRAAPVFGDYNADGRPDLFVPQRGASKLFRNDGGARFTNVTAAAGDLAKLDAWARCAVWADFAGTGRLDLFVGCLKGPNRYFRNNGDGTFTDATEAIGLTYRIFNTCGLAVVDINGDGRADVVLNNEAQESGILLGKAILPPVATAATAPATPAAKPDEN